MANLKLKKQILDVVNNQLRDNDPPAAKEAYQNLLYAGYSVQEAKEKIGAVVLEEIFDVVKSNQPYDEQRYTNALAEMVQESIDFEDTHTITTEWDKWDELVQRGYDAQEQMDEKQMVSCWWEAWELFLQIMKTAEGKTSVSEVMESQDYKYSVDAWLQDMEMELGNVGEHEKRLSFCYGVLDLFDWTYDDGDGFRCAIGEVLYETGEIEEGKTWFANWLRKEPHNAAALNAYSWCLEKEEGIKAAYQLIRREVINCACTIDNYILFERAQFLAGQLKREKDLKWIKTQRQSFREAMKRAEYHNDLYDDFPMPIQQPIVKEAKIYPNDPCPCGSGKKYKKCCGKR